MAQLHREPELGETALGLIFAILLVIAFAAAGTSDWNTERLYRRAWARANGMPEVSEFD